MTTLPEFQIPKIASEKVDENRGTFTIEPLDKGFGYTFGNSLRRVLLSSLGGAAIKSVRIEGVAHEFSTVSGVKEDVTDIVLNLKEIVVRMHTDADEVEAPLVASGPGEIKAKDIDLPAGVEILNPDAPIATLEKKTKLEMYLTIGRGRGYYDKASRQPGVTGENLLRLLERRFDNVLVRLGFAASRRQARQLIDHGHWLINGRRVDIPSYQVRPDDVISIRPNSSAADVVRSATELTAAVPPWLQADHDSLTAMVLRLPDRSEITTPVSEQLIVELYSK